MPLPKRTNAIKTFVLLGALVATHPLSAQDRTPCKNQYPCGDCAVHDNNGNDLAGFTRNYKKQFTSAGTAVVNAANDEWGYMLVRTAIVPSVSSRWETKGDLNYTQPIRTTLVMVKSKENSVSTWWARECNLDNGPLVQLRTKNQGNEEVELTQHRYDKVFRDLEAKKMTLVEYLDTFNMRDYDYLVKKNHIVSKLGSIMPEDYKSIVDYFNNFLGKFSYTDDPLITRMSFITFCTGASGTRYMGYFNVENDKLSGRLEPLNIEYERDRDSVVTNTFKKLTTRTVYIYGDDSYGLDKTMIKYAKDNEYKLRRRKTNVTTKFNDER